MHSKQRIWEIDFARGLAIILMVIFHLVVDLADFFGYNLVYQNGFWYFVGKTAAITFIIIAGISAPLNQHSLRHGLVICGWAAVVTIVTFLYNPQIYIRFGILHLLGASLLIYNCLPPLKPKLLIAISTILGTLGPLTQQQSVPTSLLLPLGLTPANFITMDYYPLVPWFGVFLIGAAASKRLDYHFNLNRAQRIPRQARPITFLGRRSLLIYLVHQPILLIILTILHESWRS